MLEEGNPIQTCCQENPLGPKSDQHQFSPNSISRSSSVKVMRIAKLISPKGEHFDLKPNSLNNS